MNIKNPLERIGKNKNILIIKYLLIIKCIYNKKEYY